MMTSNFEMALYAQLVCALLTFRLFLFQNVNCFLSSTSQSLSGNLNRLQPFSLKNGYGAGGRFSRIAPG